MTSAIRNSGQQLVTNNDSKITISSSTHTEKNVDCDFNKDSRKLLFVFRINTILIQKLIVKNLKKVQQLISEKVKEYSPKMYKYKM